MNARIKRTGISFILVIIILSQFIFSPAKAAGELLEADKKQAFDKVRSQISLGLQIVDKAVATLSKGLDQMSEQERALFLQYYDPAGTGEIDEAFAAEVLANYRKIQGRLNQEIELIYVPDRPVKCQLMTLYYTDFKNVFVCPYVLKEQNSLRIARSMVHEVAHMALVVWDRAYYYADPAAYAKLTPRGHKITQLPLIGRWLREILHGDTLYHPDAYAHFAAALVDMKTENINQNHSPESKPLQASISPEVIK